MAYIDELIFAALSVAGTDAGTNIYPESGPDEPPVPLVIVQSPEVPENTLAGASGLVNTRAQIDCYALTAKAAKQLAAQVQAAMVAASTFKALWLSTTPAYEPAVKLYRATLEFSVWNQ